MPEDSLAGQVLEGVVEGALEGVAEFAIGSALGPIGTVVSAARLGKKAFERDSSQSQASTREVSKRLPQQEERAVSEAKAGAFDLIDNPLIEI